MDYRVKGVVSTLETDSDDVHMIGIKGIGGGGKTTLARGAPRPGSWTISLTTPRT